MKIAIQGIDYSASVDGTYPLSIERALNEPTICRLWLIFAEGASLACPQRNQRLEITGDDGAKYFTGYIASAPFPELAGLTTEGPRYRIHLRALSDELLMDQTPLSSTQAAAGMTAGELMESLVMHTRSSALTTQGLSLDAPISSFVTGPGTSWSQMAGQVAAQVRASYRALGGVLSLNQIPTMVHELNEADGTFNLANLAFRASVERALANDVTVCGEREPVAYVTEYFRGDGVTTQFTLGAAPFFPVTTGTRLIEELFNHSDIDSSVWSSTGGSGYFRIGGAGLTMNGGNGIDGQTLLTWMDSMELGGTLLLEARGVTIAAGSAGLVAGLFTGLGTLSGCIAGFQLQSQENAGAVTLQPVAQGIATGSTYQVNPMHQYTLRIRIHCPECERALATYHSFGDSGAITNGGQSNEAPARLLFEIQECVNGIMEMPVTLFDGSLTSLPQTCNVVAASLIHMTGTMRALSLTNLGSGWVMTTPAGGSQYTRRLGTVTEGGECYFERSGTLVFYSGFIPKPGEQIALSYRTSGRSVGRAINSVSQNELAAAGLPPVSQWSGSVTSPAPRSSADCRNAAATMVAASAGASAIWRGGYKGTSCDFPNDVWPGDALWLKSPSMNLDAQVVIRSVKVTYGSTSPDLVSYEISFANDWADDLAIKTSGSIPADAWLPAPVSPVMLPNLTHLVISGISGTAVTINTGIVAPPGGGFEIRRRDFAFMPGDDPDLIMRGSQQTMTFSRQSANDRFYIRMYDGAMPPNYSEFSAALFINLPLES